MNRRYLLVFVGLFALVAAACGDDAESTSALEAEVSSLKAQVQTLEAEVDSAMAKMPKDETARLDTVKARGRLICAGRTDLAGFGFLDGAGKNVGFDVDLCRAVAAAIFGDPDAMELVPITASERGPTIRPAR